MHNLVYVFVDPMCRQIKNEVERLLLGSQSHPSQAYLSYPTKCYCVGLTALLDSCFSYDNSPEGRVIGTQLARALRMGDLQITEELNTQRFFAVQQLQDIHPLRDKPDPECASCHGSGISIENRDPCGKWDWWVIGGRWANAFEQLPTVEALEDDELRFNVALAADIKPSLYPSAIVTPESEWFGSHLIDRLGLLEYRSEEDLQEAAKWEEQVDAILKKYHTYLVVAVDCHS